MAETLVVLPRQESVAFLLNARAPIVQKILHRFLERDFGFPSSMLSKFRGVRDLQIGIYGAKSFGINLYFDTTRNCRVANKRVQYCADSRGVRATDVVIGTGHGIHGHEHVISPHRVAHVCDRAEGLKIYHTDYGRNKLVLDHRNLLCEGRFCEYIAPSRPSMCEHPGDHDAHAIRFSVETPHEIGTHLRNRVRRSWVECTFLVNGEVLLRHSPENLR